ncbi:hypothetical protein ABIE64_001013 [Thalassospira sp. MBR-102]|jgi:hypothetical protein|uniref:Uncharacterized protein n=1 Tax=Thalassospira permensis NBRC 106175 TaxID=1353532 RepID=A0ABR4TSZ7_9PROT|nr:hypothetical protein [Thalassospira permensis]KEO58988.1 hypothetical protein SMB34_11885 [Thalassospira permensis NBRC 106175]MBR9780359.1 hypothetical protein [Rhodospirillales bacterium]MBR9816116.1 hypothetical protein [Rhodospirillales bacterium]
MDELYAFLLLYRAIIGAAVLTAIFVILVIAWWDEVKLFFKSALYSLPLIGKTRRLSKDISVRRDGWFASERTLCDDFAGDIRRIAADPEMYDRSKSYLGKVQELGRNELGILMRVLLIAMVFVEALGFAYVLAGYTLPGASEQLQVQGSFFIAFLISCVLVFLTHQSGQELHKRGLIKKIRTWWIHDNAEDRPNLLGRTNKVTLENDQVDDNDPAYMQILHRVDTNAHVTPGAPMWTIIAAIAIIGVAIGATYVRYETYQQEKTAETIGANTSPNNSLFSLEGLASEGLPDVLTEPQTEANNQAHNEQEGARDAANLTTYAILATLFILIQIMGIGIGYKTGFAGKESSTARRIIRNFPSRTSYEAWYERKRDAIARVAQKHLSNLQARLTENATSNGVDKTHREVIQHSADRTFIEHYEQTEIKAEQSRQNSEARKLSRTVESKLQPSESIKTTSAPDPVNQGKTAAESPEEMEARIRRELLAEKEAKEKHVETEDEMRERMRKELGLGS